MSKTKVNPVRLVLFFSEKYSKQTTRSKIRQIFFKSQKNENYKSSRKRWFGFCSKSPWKFQTFLNENKLWNKIQLCWKKTDPEAPKADWLIFSDITFSSKNMMQCWFPSKVIQIGFVEKTSFCKTGLSSTELPDIFGLNELNPSWSWERNLTIDTED